MDTNLRTLSTLYSRLVTEWTVPWSESRLGIWTDAILNFFDSAGQAHGHKVYREYLLDLVWYDGLEEYFPETVPARHGLVLALESEWGWEINPRQTHRDVMEDFCKIVDVKAELKVMVFGHHGGHWQHDLVASMHGAAVNAIHRLSDERYLLIGFPWKGETFRPASDILGFTIGPGNQLQQIGGSQSAPS